MKFARYLQDTQTPEWKKAYIDYRGLKKRIAAIRKAQQGIELIDSPASSQDELPLEATRQSDAHSETASLHAVDRISPPAIPQVPDHGVAETSATSAPAVPGLTRRQSMRGRRPSFARGMSISSFRRGHNRSLSSRTTNSPMTTHAKPLAALPLQELLPELSSHEFEFFAMLDAQLDKVESFYIAREKEMLARGKLLQEQLSELNDHRELILKKHPKSAWSSGIAATIRSKFTPEIPNRSKGPVESDPEEAKEETKKTPPISRDQNRGWNVGFARSSITRMVRSSSNKDKDSDEDPVEETKGNVGKRSVALSADPDNYLYAKKKLKKAVLEFYRGLEVLHNYRVLNITGFRKALKKFEKVTKIPVQNQYMSEKIDKSAFASDKAIRNMMKDMEDV
ncbi:SPX domain-containing protein [Cyathus striatus]|nr:SPX domain-containing protein [Cyathus striatus]